MGLRARYAASPAYLARHIYCTDPTFMVPFVADEATDQDTDLRVTVSERRSGRVRRELNRQSLQADETKALECRPAP